MFGAYSPVVVTVLLVLAFIGLSVIIATYKIISGLRRIARGELKEAPRRCGYCGYNLTGRVVPRCPECGRADGFSKTFEELGVDESEVIAHAERRHKELEAKQVEEAGEAEDVAGEDH